MVENTKTYQEEAYEFVKEQILNLELKPGEFITDQQIATRLKISRTPVREAFRRLQHEGLLVYTPRRGWKVYTLTLEDIHEIFDIKVSIESMVARKAAEQQCKDQKLCAVLKETLEKMRLAANHNDIDGWIEADPILHETIFQMANNRRAHKIIENINDQWHRVRIGFVARTEHLNESFVEHEEFVTAILEGDGALAESLMAEHLNKIRNELVTLLKSMVMPFVKDGI